MFDRVCSECGGSLKGKAPTALTCTGECRTARSRRLKRAGSHEATEAMTEVVHSEINTVGREVLRDELRPIVREALTEEALRAVAGLLELTPLAVQCIHEDLLDEDKVVRQRAYTLLVKYTMGHPALVNSNETSSEKQLVVNFNLPRPVASGETFDAPGDSAVPGEADEIRTCDTCGVEKLWPREFVDESTRCITCHETLRSAVMARVGG